MLKKISGALIESVRRRNWSKAAKPDYLKTSAYEGNEVVPAPVSELKLRKPYTVYDKDGHYVSGELIRRVKGKELELKFGEFSVRIKEPQVDEIIPLDDLDRDELWGHHIKALAEEDAAEGDREWLDGILEAEKAADGKPK